VWEGDEGRGNELEEFFLFYLFGLWVVVLVLDQSMCVF
jgi:hypothetical protein